MSKKPLILVVDDDENLRNAMKEVYLTNGYVVEEASNGEDAFKKLESITPDLITLDMDMPKMGGIVFYEQICDKDGLPRYPVFVLTGRVDLAPLFNDFSVKGFMSKPFDFERLLSEVERVIKGVTTAKKALSKNIMIVDDDRATLDKLSKIFLDHDYQVKTVNNGTDAIVKMYDNPSDVILISLGLNQLAGDVVATRLHYMKKTEHVSGFLYSLKGDKLEESVIDNLKKKSGVRDIIISESVRDIFKGVDAYINQ